MYRLTSSASDGCTYGSNNRIQDPTVGNNSMVVVAGAEI